jgi:CheY-like chemotaxis protein
MADDDEDDRLLLKEALDELQFSHIVEFTEDGQDLMNYLKRRDIYTDRRNTPLPELILLDLNMPRKDGREALREIRLDSNLRHIPVVVFTTSKAEEDVLRSYDLGANSFVVKPITFEKLVEVIRTINLYWFEAVRLPCQ